MIQLREKAPRCAEELIAFAEPFARAAREHGALFFLNDEPEPGRAVRRRRRARRPGRRAGRGGARVAGAGALVGLSTHSPSSSTPRSLRRRRSRPDQISAGPVWETPTKAGRPAAGLELIAHAAQPRAEAPWFAIGGIDQGNIAEVVAAGAAAGRRRPRDPRRGRSRGRRRGAARRARRRDLASPPWRPGAKAGRPAEAQAARGRARAAERPTSGEAHGRADARPRTRPARERARAARRGRAPDAWSRSAR